jgi:segregation and condensation protein B
MSEEQTNEPVLEQIPAYRPSLENLVKALVFATPEYVTLRSIKDVLEGQYDIPEIRKAVISINQTMEENNEPFEIVEANNSLCFRTRSQYFPWVKRLFKDTSAKRLSPAALEILSLVAYKQPITKAEIESVRGVSIDGTLKGLLDRKLVTIVGKSERLGNPNQYGTTKEFCQYFNINRVPQDLPKLSEFEDLVNASALIPQIDAEGSVVEHEELGVEVEADE